MSNVQSYNALIDRFKAFASGHFILKTFSHGQIDTADLEKFTEYPFMHVVPSNVTYAKGMKTFSFQIVLADLPRDKDDKVEFQREVLSDLQRIAEDLVAEITNHRVLFGDLITVQNVSLEPFLEEFHNTLTGWTVSLDLLVPYYWDACSIPAEWNDFFESSTGGTGSILTFVDSITRDENGNVSLVNDEANPAPNYYYGTNDEGVRGWYLLTDEVGLTCATIGTCQTIIDIESAIDDLQTEMLLKANTADISAVGFSNDYDDLDNKPTIPAAQIQSDWNQSNNTALDYIKNKPTIPAAQVNSDWNATSGVAEILNKPSLPATVGDMLKSVYDTDVDGVVDSAERIQIVVRNSTGSTLTKGKIVYLSGATGNRPNAVLAQANAELTSSKTIGMVISDIANNADGQVAVNGTLHDLDTSAFTAGDTLWLSATTAGGMVANTPPSEPNHTVFIGYVARSHPNLGRIVLAIQNGYELDELHGVLITTPANNEVLTYESSTSLWKNKTIATALGYTPVPTTRTLTINGTTQDLSANRTFTIATGLTVGTTPITSGTVGRVLFEGTGNVLQEDSALSWDNTNKRLNLVSTGDNLLNLTPQASGNAIVFNNNSYIKWGTIGYIRGFSTATTFAVYNSGYTNIFNIGTSSACYVNTGTNFLIGTTTDAGFKLDVNGTARVTGVLTPENNINLYSTGTSVKTIGAYWGNIPVYGLNIQGNAGSLSGIGAVPNGYVVRIGSGFGITSTDNVDIDNVRIAAGTFNPTSGSTRLNLLSIVSTINQTGGANGITRGIYINPTLTAAADFRAIEVTGGTTVLAPSVTARASLRIPSGTAPTSPVNGDIWFDGTLLKMQIGGVTKTFTLI